MRAGRMNQRIAVQRSKLKPGAISGNQVIWETIAVVWAEVKGIRGREYFSSQQVQSETTLRVWVRYIPDITSKDRLKFRCAGSDTECWNIKSIVSDRADGRMEIICEGAESD